MFRVALQKCPPEEVLRSSNRKRVLIFLRLASAVRFAISVCQSHSQIKIAPGLMYSRLPVSNTFTRIKLYSGDSTSAHHIKYGIGLMVQAKDRKLCQTKLYGILVGQKPTQWKSRQYKSIFVLHSR